MGTNIILGDSNNIVFKEGFIDIDMIITHRTIYDYANSHYLKTMINEDNTTQDIVYDDNQLFSILKLSELKGTNAVACTESIQCYYKIIYAF